MIEIRNITKDFKNTKALNNVSMSINRGDIYGFIGENGAGKSTLIKIMANVIKATSGEVIYNFDKNIGSIQAIVEEPSLHMDLNALNNLRFQNDLFNLKKSDDELKDVLRLVGLDDVIKSKKKAKKFSLGMKQRLSIAMSLLPSPKVILLDEPMNGLDPLGIKEIRELILKLNKEQRVTFLISSHILSELDRIATKYGFISRGVLVKEISHEELHKSTRSYIRVIFENDISMKDLDILKVYKYEKIDSKTIHILDNLENNEVMRYLFKNDCMFKSSEVVSKSIEDYYIEIIRGDRYD